MKIVIDECLPKRVTQFFEKGSAYNDLLHLKDKILKAVDSVSKGEIEHIS